MVAVEEEDAGVLALRHILRRLEEGELVVAGLAGVGAELRAVAALVAHLVDVDDLVALVGHDDRDVRAVRAGVHTVLADGGALQAALALALAGHLENAVLGDGVGLGDERLRGDLILVGHADHSFGKARGVGNALDHGRGAAVRVARAVHALDIGLKRGALALHLDAVCGHEVGIDLLADGGEHEVAGDGELLAGLHGAAAAGLVGLAEHHLVAQQHTLGLLDGSGQLDELHALVDGELQLVLVGGHELLGAAVENGGVRAHALGDAGGVHGGVARADDHDVAGEVGLDLLLFLLHPLDDALHVALDVELAGLPRAGGEEDVGVAHFLQLRDGGSALAALDLNAVAHHQGDVLVDGLVGNAEGGNDVARHAAELALTLEDGGLDAGAAAEVRRGDTGRAAADDGDALALDALGQLDGGHQGIVALLRGEELGVADVDALLIEIAGALALAAVRADGAGDERQGVLLGDELERGAVKTLAAQLEVLGNVLLDGAAALAGRDEAVEPGHLLGGLAAGQGLDGLEVMVIRAGGGGEVGDGGGVGAGEGAVLHRLDLLDHLEQAVVAARLENGGGDGDGPDARGKELIAVEVFRAAGEGDTHLAAERAGDAAAHLDGQREEAAAGHIHLVVRQLAARGVHGEGVGELETELQTLLVRELLQTLEHGHRVLPLEILVEVMLVEHDVVVAHGVENAAGGLVAEDGGVALDEGVQVLLREQIACDALDLLRRAAVERGDGDGARNARGDVRDEIALGGEQLGEDLLAFLELRGPARVHHVVDVAVDLAALDALEVVADGHIEHEPVGIAETVDLADDLERAPGLDVLVLRLRHGQLGGPLLIVALVGGEDAGTGHAGGKLGAVHLLYGLDLEEARAGEVGGDDVLRELAVGAGGGAEGRFDALTEDGQALARGLIFLVDAEDVAALGVLGHDPVHQGRERNGIHFLRHRCSSYVMFP